MELYDFSIIVSHPIMASASYGGIWGGGEGGGGRFLSERTEREKALRTGFSPTAWDYTKLSEMKRNPRSSQLAVFSW
jgi:hypothetical protein